MESLNETAWFQTGEQNQPPGATPGQSAFFQMDTLGYDFSFPDMDNNLTLYSQPAPFPNLECFGLNGAPRTKSRVSLACIPCRSRHTRCDAAMPICSQCRTNTRSCSYTQSRRGRVKLARVERRQQTQKDGESSETGQLQGLNSLSSSGSGDASSASTTDSSRSQGQSPISASNIPRSQVTPTGSVSETSDSAKLLDLYYASFHDAHPIALPRKFLDQRLQTNSLSLQLLISVMEFIGSLFAPKSAKEELRIRVENMIQFDSVPETGFTVQALQLYAIAIHSCDEFEHARTILDRAIQIAVQIDMQSSSFAAANGEGCAVLEESWRRTWWQLFVADGSFAAIRHCSAFSMNEILTDVHLPCEEAEYQSGNIPPPRTMEEYNAREFAGEEIIFSSFTYLIDLGQILGNLLALGTEPGEPFEPDVVAADAALMNWCLYLPKRKNPLIEEPGKVDEVMFQAHLLYHTSSVYLHRPRSQLTYGSVERTSKCASPPSEKSVEEQQRAYDFHTTKVLEASEAAIALFTLPTPFLRHTPLVICSLTVSLLAQIAACRLRLKGVVYTAARDRIRLALGVIKTLGEAWPIAQKTVKEVQIIAREAFSIPKPTDPLLGNGNNTPRAQMI